MRNALALAGWALLALLATGQEQLPAPKEKAATPDHNYSGYYACDGRTIAGKPYDGVVVIEKVHEVYVVQWANGGSTTQGIGQQAGDLLVVGWKMQGPDGALGVTVYRLQKDGSLHGTYCSNPGNGKLCPERLTLLRKLNRKEDI